MSNAVATLVGQNLGAKLPERAVQSVTITANYNMIFMAIVTVLLLIFAQPLVGFFVPAVELAQREYAILSLQILSSGYIFYGLSMIFTQAFNGAGDTKTPSWIYFFGFWVFQVPFAYLLHKYTGIGVAGVFLAVPIAETLMAIAVFILFKQGKWKKVEV